MIPDFQSTMLPLLSTFNGDQIKEAKELRDLMINHFTITEEEQKVQTPSGKQLLFYNRIAWAISYLKMAELIITTERGKYKLSDLGKNILKNPPEKITIKFLNTLPNFSINRNPNKDKHISEDDEVIDKTPDELIEIGISQINNDLSNILISQIKKCSPYFFEQIVMDLLLKMGYGGSDINNGEVTSKSGDEGIDGIIKEDKLGLDKIYIQAKKWENTIGRPEIQKFVGALHGKRAKKGIFITTSNFSKEAIEYANNLEVVVVLIDGNKLTNLMIDNELGVTVKEIYKIRKIDSDYFIEE
jgi:restriction system protein